MIWSLSKYFPSRFIPTWLLTWLPGPYARPKLPTRRKRRYSLVGIGLLCYVWYSQREKNKREREAHELYKQEQLLKIAEFERRATREGAR